jgi:citrate lyase subunit beta/citryl-CoA lyase
VIIDLEDAVADDDNACARDRVAAWRAAGGDAVVRVNGVGTPWFAADIDVARHAAGIMLPKAEESADLSSIAELTAGTVPVIALIETARGVMCADAICSDPQVVRVALGNIDLAAELGVEPTSRLALGPARSQLVYASRARRLAPPIDGVTTLISDLDAVAHDALHARELGFGAKLLIHPAQVGPVARAFAPTADELAWAHAVLGAVEDGVGVHDGHMVDGPVLARARRILSGEAD